MRGVSQASLNQLIARLLKAGVSCLRWRALPRGARRAIIGQLGEIMDHMDRVEMMASIAPELELAQLRQRANMAKSKVLLGTRPSLAFTPTGGVTNDLVEGFFREHSGGTFIDIGANIGLTTVPVARNPSVQCFRVRTGTGQFRKSRCQRFGQLTSRKRDDQSGRII
jgi:hypothetical protein